MATSDHRCIISVCNSSRKDKNVQLFKLPTNNTSWRDQLLDVIKKYGDHEYDDITRVQGNKIYICEKHFQKSSFIHNRSGKSSKKELKPGSIPTLHLVKKQPILDEEKLKSFRNQHENNSTGSIDSSFKSSEPEEKIHQQYYDKQSEVESRVETITEKIQEIPQGKSIPISSLQNTHWMNSATTVQLEFPKLEEEIEPWNLLSKVMLLAYLNDTSSSYGKQGLRMITGVKIIRELYRRCTEKEEIIETLRTDTTKKILAYVRANSNKNPNDQSKEIKTYIDEFARKVALVNETS